METLGRYSPFVGIDNKENCKTLLNCIHAEKVYITQDIKKSLSFVYSKKLALTLDENCRLKTSDNSIIAVPKGKIIDFSDAKYQDAKPDLNFYVLIMDKEAVYMPCWFSCYFHAKFIDNINNCLY